MLCHNRTWRPDELNHLDAGNLPDTPDMDRWWLMLQGLGAPAQPQPVPPARKEPEPVRLVSPALLQLGLSHSVGPWTLVQKWPARAAGPCESACAAAAGSEPFGGSVDPGAEVAHFFHVLVSRVVAVRSLCWL